MNALRNKHVVITGGGSGIGLAIARHFDAHGASLSLIARQKKRLEESAKLFSKACAISADISDEAAVNAAFRSAREHYGPVQILVNNAGIAPTAAFLKTSLKQWRDVFSVNLDGAFLCAKAALPDMLDANFGRIINIASTAGLKAYPYASAYVASKHAVIGLTRSLAAEFAKTNITVNSICPGFTDTDIVQKSIQTIVEKTGRHEDDALFQLVRNNPQERLIDPDEVASLAYWLCSEQARSITGQSLAVAGGEVI